MKQLRDDSEVLSNFLKEILTFQTCSCIYLNSPFTWAPNTHLLPSSSCGAKSFGFYLHLPKGLCIRRNKPTEVCGLSCEHSKNKTNTKNTEAKIYHGVLWIMTSLRSGINRERLAPLKGPVVNPGECWTFEQSFPGWVTSHGFCIYCSACGKCCGDDISKRIDVIMHSYCVRSKTNKQETAGTD